MTPLRVAFFGTPAFALTTLECLVASRHPVVLVVTQPDRPRGRGHKVVPSPVKVFAAARHVPVLQPEKLRDETVLAEFDTARADIGVVAAYGRILPPSLLTRPPLGMINVHASLLPRWRGAAPIHRAILAGDRETGVTIMRVVAALDAGPMLAQERISIDPDQTSADLEPRIAELGARLLVRTLDRLAEGPLPEVPQREADVTYAHRLERADSRIDWTQPADRIHNQIRGLQPWPMAAVLLRGRRITLVTSTVAHLGRCAEPAGTIIGVTPDAFDVAAQPGAVRITAVQPEGKTAMAVRQYRLGHPLHPGDRVEPVPLG